MFDRFISRYVRGVLYFMHHRNMLWGTVAGSIVLLVVFMGLTKTGLIPDEDTGSVMVSMNTKPGTSMAQNKKVMERLDSKLDSIAEIEHSGAVAGFSFSGSGSSQAMYFISLRDWAERDGKGNLSMMSSVRYMPVHPTFRMPLCSPCHLNDRRIWHGQRL